MNQASKNQGWSKHKDRNLQIRTLFQELKSTRLVADKMQLSPATIRHSLKQAGVPTPRQGRRHNPYSACDRNSELVLKMCAEGSNLNEMAAAVGTKGAEVKKFLRRQGVTKEFEKATCGEKHYAWKGRLIDKDGYVLIHQKGHPNARKHTHYLFEHRLVMEKALGRLLGPSEVIHHRNGVKHDNRLENLQLFASNGEHLAVDLKGRCPKWSQEGKERIQKGTTLRWLRARTSSQPPSTGDAPPYT